MLFLHLILTCIGVVVFQGREYKKLDLHFLLDGAKALQVDLSALQCEDLKFIPVRFVPRATASQFEVLKQYLHSHVIPGELRSAISEREASENASRNVLSIPTSEAEDAALSLLALSGDQREPPSLSSFFDFTFHKVTIPYMEGLSCNVRGPDLVHDWERPIDSIYVLSEVSKTYTERIKGSRNSLRWAGWNFLMNAFPLPADLPARDRWILTDWALIAVICSFGMPRNSAARHLISWLRGIHLFLSKSTVPLQSWVALLHQCKQLNAELWQRMVELSMARFRHDPGFRNFSPYQNLEAPKVEREVLQIPKADLKDDFEISDCHWIPALEQDMKSILSSIAPTYSRLPELPTCLINGPTIPFMSLDPPRIAKIFKQITFVKGGKVFRGAKFRFHISRQYRILRGELTLSTSTEDTRLIAEWAMITLIFHGSNLPKSHSPFMQWLLSIPIDFAKPKKAKKEYSLNRSLWFMRQGRDANVKLWNALAMMAAKCFLADPDRERLPLLEDWCQLKGLAPLKSSERLCDELEVSLNQPTTNLPELIDIYRGLERQARFDLPHGEIFAHEISQMINLLFK